MVNPIGEDLVEGADAITLIDEMSSNLIFDSTSVVIKNTKTNEILPNDQWKVSVEDTPEGQRLSFVIPDNLPLTINYETSINAPPNTPVNISNYAHWYGYEGPSGGGVNDDDFVYEIGGSVSTDVLPSLKIIKLDMLNTNLHLSDAEFTVQKAEIHEDGTFTPVGEKHTGTTDENGSVSFSEGKDLWMEYNNIYCITETKAPDGYILDSTPYYFSVAKSIGKDDNGKDIYPNFPDGVTVWYNSPRFTYIAYNNMGKISVDKKFIDSDGNTTKPFDGVYKFGLFNTENPSDSPLGILTITYKNGNASYMMNGITAERAEFDNIPLNPDITYYIYELDDNDKPIMNDSITSVDGKTIHIVYPNGENSGTVSADSTEFTAEICNEVMFFTLSNTGGAGIAAYIVTGAILMFGSFIVLYMFKIRKREGEAFSK